MYRRYLRLRPRDFSVRRVILHIEFERDHYRAVVRDCHMILKLVRRHRPPEYVFEANDQLIVWNLLGHSYLELNRPQRALVYFRKAHRFNEWCYSWYNLGRAYFRLKKYQRAAACLEIAIRQKVPRPLSDDADAMLRLIAGRRFTNRVHRDELEYAATSKQHFKGRLLLVHGEMDNNVHPAGTIRLMNALIKAGKRFDFMMMPGKPHGYGDMQPYFTQMTFEYFAEHLLGDYYRGSAEMNDKQERSR